MNCRQCEQGCDCQARQPLTLGQAFWLFYQPLTAPLLRLIERIGARLPTSAHSADLALYLCLVLTVGLMFSLTYAA